MVRIWYTSDISRNNYFHADCIFTSPSIVSQWSLLLLEICKGFHRSRCSEENVPLQSAGDPDVIVRIRKKGKQRDRCREKEDRRNLGYRASIHWVSRANNKYRLPRGRNVAFALAATWRRSCIRGSGLATASWPRRRARCTVAAQVSGVWYRWRGRQCRVYRATNQIAAFLERKPDLWRIRLMANHCGRDMVRVRRLAVLPFVSDIQ